jgi:hypothetical protein
VQFDLSSAAALVGGGTNSGNIGSLIGSATGLPFASQIGGALSSVFSSVFKGHPFDAAGMFAGLHSPTLAPLDDTRFYKEDARIYVEWAKALGISVEEAFAVIQYDGQVNNYPSVIDAYRTQDGRADTGNKMNQFLSWVKAYNKANPLAQIHIGEMGPRSDGNYNALSVPEPRPTMTSVRASLAQNGIGSTVIEAAPSSTSELATASTTVVENAPTATSNSFLGMSNAEIQAILKGGAAGAQKGVIDAAMQTSIGKQAQDSGAKQWVNDNGLAIGGGLAILGSVITYLIATRK